MDSKWKSIWKAISGKSKFIFPVVVVIAIAVTVVVALASNSKKSQIVDEMEADDISSIEQKMIEEPYIDYDSIPLITCNDEKIKTLINDFFDAWHNGDTDRISSMVTDLDDRDLIWLQEMSVYIESFSINEIYMKQGYQEGAYIVFTCYTSHYKGRDIEIPGLRTFYVLTNEQGNYYISNKMLSEDEDTYVKNIVNKEDLVDLQNKVTVEYNEVLNAHPEMGEYLKAMQDEVDKQVGMILAQKKEEEKASEEAAQAQSEEVTDPNASESAEVTPTEEKPADIYAQTKSAVNVRASDSEKADKVGKATKGLKVKVLEQRENGWSKVIFEDKEAFIKSEFLTVLEQADNVESAGKVKAKSNVNVRAAADKEASSYGIIVGGEEVDMISQEGEWTKVKYKGQVGYVMSEFLE